MTDQRWKRAERYIARRLFGVERNPLSGANNRWDDGSKRSGDVLYKPALVEIKLRKDNATIKRARETQEEAKRLGLPWIHLEVGHGDNRFVAIVVDWKYAKAFIRALRREWEKGK